MTNAGTGKDNQAAFAVAPKTSNRPQPGEGPALSMTEFEGLKEVIARHVGVAVTPVKIPLLRARLRIPMQRAGVSTFADYVAMLKDGASHEVVSELADAVTTNHTHFWREAAHFEIFEKTVMPAIVAHAKAQRSNTLRVWCAASSTGQEPYTLAALMMQALEGQYASWDAGVLATDISARALTAAEQGHYPSEDIQPLPPVLQRRMFQPVGSGVMGIRPEVAKEVTFRRLNLVSSPFRFKRPFDVIFCRNVMIYFDDQTRLDVVAKLAEVTRPGGYLFVGLAEGLGNVRWFDQLSPACFRRNEVKP